MCMSFDSPFIHDGAWLTGLTAQRASGLGDIAKLAVARESQVKEQQ